MTVLELYKEFNLNVQKRYQELNALLSQYDLQEQDLLHYLELGNCNAATMAKIAKELKNLRIQRRTVKEEFVQIQSLKDSMKSRAHIASVGHSTYTCKTDVLQKIAQAPKGYMFKTAKKTKQNN